MIPQVDRNEHWQDPLLLELLKVYKLEQHDTGVYIHWCEINNNPDTHPAIAGNILPYIPEHIIRDAQSGRARIVFSTMQESTNPGDVYPIEHCHDFDLTLEDFCNQNNIPHNNVVWVSGDLRVQQRQKSKSIRAFGFTCYGNDISRQVQSEIAPEDWTLKPITQRHFVAQFICLQRYMKPGRVFWTWLLKDKPWLMQHPGGFLSIADRVHGWSFLDKARAFIAIMKQHQTHMTSTPWSDEQIKNMWHDLADVGIEVPYILDVADHNSNWCAGADTTLSSLPWYNASFASVITETDIQSNALFISEATFRAFVYQQPCIWVGQQGIVKQLNDWGFKTWDWLFSEDYDNEPLMIDRLFKCRESLLEVIKLEKTPEILERVHEQNLYNWNHLITTFKQDQGYRFKEILTKITQ